MTKENDEIIIENAENMSEAELKKAIKIEKARRTRAINKAKREAALAAKETKNNGDSFDLDVILSTPKYKKKSLSFNQDKSVAEALNFRAEAAGKKTSEALNLILESIIDIENGICKIDIEEKREEKIANTYKIDERILDILKKESDSRNMSLNEYLNKVLKVVLNIG
ncbi:hypothetical protein H8J81_15685 [Clostridium perfringens]|uniref:hypothetical protein n=1 Tax=Clostridium perfringens TaxID=1502 RepID=UPI0018E452F7|nr:hypothetical protein [Clostridium perfringens]MBI6048948.1 hypothetical protein [Clostridium perfringens]